ncbi:Polygalacturonase [Nymphaea thermarum]|nr:Polygalacturonase [Nymphaea thermarum]
MGTTPATTILLIALLLPLVLLQSATAAEKTFNVLNYGAKADAVTDDSPAFLKAWSAVCAAATSSAATMYVPSGQYLLHPTLFYGPCVNGNITVQIDGHLVASSNYTLYGAKGYWLKFDRVKGLRIQGGYLHGKGSALWACKAGSGTCPSGATSLLFNNVEDVLLTSLTSVDSELYHIVIDSSSNVQVDAVKVNASGTSPNTDGIHVEESTGVKIMNTAIKTGDDCICIGPGTQNLWIEKVTCGPGHGISIGSLGKSADEAGVQNVTVKNVAFSGSTNGLRIKSWARSSSSFAKGAFDNPVFYCSTGIMIQIFENENRYQTRNRNFRPLEVLVPVANGSEEMEAVIIIDVLRRAKANVIVASVEDKLEVVASRKVKLVADMFLKEAVELPYDLIVLSGGLPGITYDGATMDGVKNPIIIDQHYCPHDIDCPAESSGVQISDITYNNIKGTSATQAAVTFNCSSSTPCQGIKVSNVQLTYMSKPSMSYCEYAYGSASTGVVPPINCLQ